MEPAGGIKLDGRSIRALILGGTSIFMMGGIIFGVASLFPVFQRLGSFASSCDLVSQCHSNLRGCQCDAQTVTLQNLATLGFLAADFSSVIWGVVVDRIAPPAALGWATAISCTALVMLGFAFLGSAEAPSSLSDSFTVVALVLAGAAGPGVSTSILVGLLQLPGAERSSLYESAVSCLVAGVFDLSALTFAIFFALDGVGFSVPASCFSWAGISVACAVVLVTIGFKLPEPPGKQPDAPASATEETALLNETYDSRYNWVRPTFVNGFWSLLFGPRLSKFQTKTDLRAADSLSMQAAMSARPSQNADETKEAQVSKDAPESTGKPMFELRRSLSCERILEWQPTLRPLIAALLTRNNTLLILSMGTINLLSTIYLNSSQDNYTLIFEPETAASLSSNIFIVFPIVAFVSSFAFIHFFDSVQAETPFILLIIVNSMWISLYIAPVIASQYVAASVFGLVRMLNWAAFFHYISSNPLLYKPHLVGRCIGYNLMCVAIIGDALAPLLMQYAAYGSWPPEKSNRYHVIKVGLLSVQVPLSALLAWSVRRTRLAEHDEELRLARHV